MGFEVSGIQGFRSLVLWRSFRKTVLREYEAVSAWIGVGLNELNRHVILPPAKPFCLQDLLKRRLERQSSPTELDSFQEVGGVGFWSSGFRGGLGCCFWAVG